MVVIATESATNATQTMDYNTIGRTVRSALMKAQTESRLIIGLGSAIKVLSKAPEGSLFCIMAEPQAGDSATHMHEVLLEAFCYENDIYVIKVDSADKLSRILNMNTLETCCLLTCSQHRIVFRFKYGALAISVSLHFLAKFFNIDGTILQSILKL
uniref:Ribosomal protein eL8/eL30/eS12/Gadd45 domain-containing protein n=1 Tax=Megaselia scalaris TaxID=36166 RepID=T1GJS3_MEGSC